MAAEQVVGQVRAGVAARAAAEACGKQGSPRVEAVAGVLVREEESEAPAVRAAGGQVQAVEAGREQERVEAEALAVAARALERQGAEDLAVRAAVAGDLGLAAGVALVREPVLEEDLEEEQEVAGREVVDLGEEVEDRAEV